MDVGARRKLDQLWSSLPSRRDSSETMFVDLMHGHVELVLRSLMIAKCIQSFTGCRLVGILGSPGVVTRSTTVDFELNEQIAEAFQLDEVVHVPAELPVFTAQTQMNAIHRFAGMGEPGQELPVEARAALAQIKSYDGFPIGRIISETFLRSELVATVKTGDRLVYWAEHVLGLDEWFNTLVLRYAPTAFVTGHIDYSPWGHLAERLVRSGKRVVYFRCDPRVQINLIDDLGHDETLHGRVRHAETRAFAAFEQAIGKDQETFGLWSSRADARLTAVRGGLARNWRWVDDAPDHGWESPFKNDRPTYIAFAHTFTDQPLADRSLFADHAHWLEATLEHAARSQAYNLVVKLHPYDELFDVSGTGERLIQRFSEYGNIQITRQHITQDIIARSFDAGLTVRGTPGIEMACLGLPIVLAGSGPFSDIGFCLTPKSREEYFDLLSHGPTFPIDMDIQATRARLFLSFDRFWAAPSSTLVPPFSACSTEQAFDGLRDAFQSAAFETDSLCLSLRKAWPLQSPKLVSIELDSALEPTREAEPVRKHKLSRTLLDRLGFKSRGDL